MSRFWTAHQHN